MERFVNGAVCLSATISDEKWIRGKILLSMRKLPLKEFFCKNFTLYILYEKSLAFVEDWESIFVPFFEKD